MPRSRLTDRRPSVTERVAVDVAGRQQHVLVTIGFDEVTSAPREVFCADWKSGAELHSIVIDACILMSRLLQHGDDPAELAATLCQPPTVLGQVAAVVDRITKDNVVQLVQPKSGEKFPGLVGVVQSCIDDHFGI